MKSGVLNPYRATFRKLVAKSSAFKAASAKLMYLTLKVGASTVIKSQKIKKAAISGDWLPSPTAPYTMRQYRGDDIATVFQKSKNDGRHIHRFWLLIACAFNLCTGGDG